MNGGEGKQRAAIGIIGGARLCGAPRRLGGLVGAAHLGLVGSRLGLVGARLGLARRLGVARRLGW